MGRRKMTDKEKIAAKNKKIWKDAVSSYKRQMNSDYEECMNAINRGAVSTPTYTYDVGDRVIFGAFDYTTILEKFDNGKYYKTFEITKNIAYGKYMGEKYRFGYRLWTELRPYSTNDDNIPKLRENEDIKFNYGQRDIQSLIYQYYGGKASGIDMEPDYQRELVWNESQKVALIDSIYKNIDIGKFTFIKRKYDPNDHFHLEVLDGKQRIKAILDFYECRIKYKGFTFNEMNWRDQYHFRGYHINWAETDHLTDEQKYRYFLKLNTGGVPIPEDHIKKVRELWLNSKLQGFEK